MSAEIILYNAKIATNAVPSFVEAIAISDGKVTATGGNEEILRLREPATHVIDGRRRTFARRRSAHVERAGGADACSAVGPDYRRVDGVSIRRAPNANAR